MSSSHPLRELTQLALFCALNVLPVFQSTAGASPSWQSGTASPCGSWNLVPTPSLGDKSNFLTSVTALSADDAWSVGEWRHQSGLAGPMALHWNGAAWSSVALPDSSHLGTQPRVEGVEAAPNADVWAVGGVTTGYPTDSLPLLLRWRNSSWDYVDTMTLRPQTVYPFAARGGRLAEVEAITPVDIWAVGQAAGYGDAQATTVPLAAHWDGSSWTDIEVPSVANRHHELTGLVVIASDDVWAIGDYRNIGQGYRAVTYHWDGTSWSYVYNPLESEVSSGLEDIVATGPNDVWAIGGSSSSPVVLMHWDGTQWSLVQAPPNYGGSLAVLAPNDLWVSGWNGYWHWDGSSWTEVPVTVPGATYVIRNGGMEVLGACDLWNVGFWTLADGITGFSLAERLSNVSIGTGYCSSTTNSTGGAAGIFGAGSAHWSAGTLKLEATPVTTQFGLFFHGQNQTQLSFGNGWLCTSADLVRGATIQPSGNLASYIYDNSDSLHQLSVYAGTTRNFQYWFRDTLAGGALFNTSDAIAITIQP